MRNHFFSAILICVSPAVALSEFFVADTGLIGLKLTAEPGIDCFPFLPATTQSTFRMELTGVSGMKKMQGSLIFNDSPFIDLDFSGQVEYEESALSGRFVHNLGGLSNISIHGNINSSSFAFLATSGGCNLNLVSGPYDLSIYPPGDSNLDGVFNSADLVEVFVAGRYLEDAKNTHWREGDWNGDFIFDTNDFVHAFRFGDYIRTATPAPEPSIALASVFGGILICFRQRQFRRIL